MSGFGLPDIFSMYSPLKRFYHFVLKKIIGNFLKTELDVQQLEVQITTGTITLTNLDLNIDILNDALEGLPLTVVSGYIKSVTAVVPWRNILSEHCKLSISGLTLEVVPSSQVEKKVPSRSSLLNVELTEREKAELDHHVKLHKDLQSTLAASGAGQEGGDLPFSGANVNSTDDGLKVVESFLEQVLSQTELEMEDVCLKLMHQQKNGERVSVMQIKLPWLALLDIHSDQLNTPQDTTTGDATQASSAGTDQASGAANPGRSDSGGSSAGGSGRVNLGPKYEYHKAIRFHGFRVTLHEEINQMSMDSSLFNPPPTSSSNSHVSSPQQLTRRRSDDSESIGDTKEEENSTIIHGDMDQDCIIHLKVKMKDSIGPTVESTCFIRQLRALLTPRQLALLLDIMAAMGQSSRQLAIHTHIQHQTSSQHTSAPTHITPAQSDMKDPSIIGSGAAATAGSSRPLTAQDFNIIEDLIENRHHHPPARVDSVGAHLADSRMFHSVVSSVTSDDQFFDFDPSSSIISPRKSPPSGQDPMAYTPSFPSGTNSNSGGHDTKFESPTSGSSDGTGDVCLWTLKVLLKQCSIVLMESDEQLWPTNWWTLKDPALAPAGNPMVSDPDEKVSGVGEFVEPMVRGITGDHLCAIMKQTVLFLTQTSTESDVNLAVGSVQLYEYLRQMSLRSVTPHAASRSFSSSSPSSPSSSPSKPPARAAPNKSFIFHGFYRSPLLTFSLEGMKESIDDICDSARESCLAGAPADGVSPSSGDEWNYSHLDFPSSDVLPEMRAFIESTNYMLRPHLKLEFRSAVHSHLYLRPDARYSLQQHSAGSSVQIVETSRLILELQPALIDMDLGLSQRLQDVTNAITDSSLYLSLLGDSADMSFEIRSPSMLGIPNHMSAQDSAPHSAAHSQLDIMDDIAQQQNKRHDSSFPNYTQPVKPVSRIIISAPVLYCKLAFPPSTTANSLSSSSPSSHTSARQYLNSLGPLRSERLLLELGSLCAETLSSSDIQVTDVEDTEWTIRFHSAYVYLITASPSPPHLGASAPPHSLPANFNIKSKPKRVMSAACPVHHIISHSSSSHSTTSHPSSLCSPFVKILIRNPLRASFHPLNGGAAPSVSGPSMDELFFQALPTFRWWEPASQATGQSDSTVRLFTGGVGIGASSSALDDAHADHPSVPSSGVFESAAIANSSIVLTISLPQVFADLTKADFDLLMILYEIYAEQTENSNPPSYTSAQTHTHHSHPESGTGTAGVDHAVRSHIPPASTSNPSRSILDSGVNGSSYPPLDRIAHSTSHDSLDSDSSSDEEGMFESVVGADSVILRRHDNDDIYTNDSFARYSRNSGQTLVAGAQSSRPNLPSTQVDLSDTNRTPRMTAATSNVPNSGDEYHGRITKGSDSGTDDDDEHDTQTRQPDSVSAHGARPGVAEEEQYGSASVVDDILSNSRTFHPTVRFSPTASSILLSQDGTSESFGSAGVTASPYVHPVPSNGDNSDTDENAEVSDSDGNHETGINESQIFQQAASVSHASHFFPNVSARVPDPHRHSNSLSASIIDLNQFHSPSIVQSSYISTHSPHASDGLGSPHIHSPRNESSTPVAVAGLALTSSHVDTKVQADPELSSIHLSPGTVHPSHKTLRQVYGGSAPQTFKHFLALNLNIQRGSIALHENSTTSTGNGSASASGSGAVPPVVPQTFYAELGQVGIFQVVQFDGKPLTYLSARAGDLTLREFKQVVSDPSALTTDLSVPVLFKTMGDVDHSDPSVGSVPSDSIVPGRLIRGSSSTSDSDAASESWSALRNPVLIANFLIHLNSTATIRDTTAVINLRALTWQYSVESQWIFKFIDFFSPSPPAIVSPTPSSQHVPGSEPRSGSVLPDVPTVAPAAPAVPSVVPLTQDVVKLYLHAYDCAVDYNPLPVECRAVLMFDHIQLSTTIYTTSPSSSLKLEIRDAALYLLNRSSKPDFAQMHQSDHPLARRDALATGPAGAPARQWRKASKSLGWPYLHRIQADSVISYLEQKLFARVATLDHAEADINTYTPDPEYAKSPYYTPNQPELNTEIRNGLLTVLTCADSFSSLIEIIGCFVNSITRTKTVKEVDISFPHSQHNEHDLDALDSPLKYSQPNDSHTDQSHLPHSDSGSGSGSRSHSHSHSDSSHPHGAAAVFRDGRHVPTDDVLHNQHIINTAFGMPYSHSEDDNSRRHSVDVLGDIDDNMFGPDLGQPTNFGLGTTNFIDDYSLEKSRETSISLALQQAAEMEIARVRREREALAAQILDIDLGPRNQPTFHSEDEGKYSRPHPGPDDEVVDQNARWYTQKEADVGAAEREAEIEAQEEQELQNLMESYGPKRAKAAERERREREKEREVRRGKLKELMAKRKKNKGGKNEPLQPNVIDNHVAIPDEDALTLQKLKIHPSHKFPPSITIITFLNINVVWRLLGGEDWVLDGSESSAAPLNPASSGLDASSILPSVEGNSSASASPSLSLSSRVSKGVHINASYGHVDAEVGHHWYGTEPVMMDHHSFHSDSVPSNVSLSSHSHIRTYPPAIMSSPTRYSSSSPAPALQTVSIPVVSPVATHGLNAYVNRPLPVDLDPPFSSSYASSASSLGSHTHSSNHFSSPGVGMRKGVRLTDQVIELHFEGCTIRLDTFAPHQQMASRTAFSIHNFEIHDCISTSPYNKFLCYYRIDPHGRELHSNMIDVDMVSVRPDPVRSDREEYRLSLNLLPIRLNVDQDAVEFFIHFFSPQPASHLPQRAHTSDSSNPSSIHHEHSSFAASHSKSASSSSFSYPNGDSHVPTSASSRTTSGFSTNATTLHHDNKHHPQSNHRPSSGHYSPDSSDEEKGDDDNGIIGVDGHAPKSSVKGGDSQHVEDQVYIQYFQSKAVKICIDYKPKRLNFKELQQGDYSQFVHLFPLEGVEIELKRLRLTGLDGWGKLLAQMGLAWLNDIRRTQLHRYFAGIQPIRSFVNVGEGVADLLLMPIHQYKKNGRLAVGLQKGTVSFMKHLALEGMNVVTKVAQKTQDILETVDDIITSSSHSSHSKGNKNRRSRRQQHKHNYQLQQSALQAQYKKEGKVYSKMSNAPVSYSEGLRQAYEALSRALSSAAHSIVVVPQEEYQKYGPKQAAKSVVKAVPSAIIRPMIGATEALSKALLGVQNTVNPKKKLELDDKYKSKNIKI